MPENVLYFPYIRVPKNSWFMRILLYWDNVGSIVPYDYIHKPEFLGEYMQGLVKEGLVIQIIPGQYINSIPNFVAPFLEIAEKRKYQLEKTKLRLETLPNQLIHIEKMGKIAKELCTLGLAREKKRPWYYVERDLAQNFMAYLASVLGNLDEINSRPITDTATNLKVFRESSNTRTLLLEKLLPAPSNLISVEEIARFKDKNKSQLLKFRNEIETFLIQYNSIQSSEDKIEFKNRFLSNAQISINEIIDSMKSNGWNRISIGGLISHSIAGLTLADALVSGGIYQAIAAAFNVASVAYDKYKEVKGAEITLNSNMAYAAIASQEFLNR